MASLWLESFARLIAAVFDRFAFLVFTPRKKSGPVFGLQSHERETLIEYSTFQCIGWPRFAQTIKAVGPGYLVAIGVSPAPPKVRRKDQHQPKTKRRITLSPISLPPEYCSLSSSLGLGCYCVGRAEARFCRKVRAEPGMPAVLEPYDRDPPPPPRKALGMEPGLPARACRSKGAENLLRPSSSIEFFSISGKSREYSEALR